MSELSPEQIAELRSVAEAATQGEWKRGLWPDTFTINGPGYDICRIIDDDDARPSISEEKSLCAEEDADHIAAFDPPTCLALLAALAEAQAEVQRVTDAYYKTADEVEQILGRVLGYPKYAPEMPTPDPDDVCVGEHVPQTIAAEAAGHIQSLRDALAEAQQQAREATNALVVAFSELHKISLLTSLGGEVDDYEDVTESVRKLADERDAAQQRAEKAESKATQLFNALEKTEQALESKYDATHLLAIAEADRDRLAKQVSAMREAMQLALPTLDLAMDISLKHEPCGYYCSERAGHVDHKLFNWARESKGSIEAALAAPEGK